LPLSVTCLLPSGRVITPSLPAPADAVGLPPLMVSGFQNALQAAVSQTTLPVASRSEL
jgi:hypothetical protein